MKYTEVCPGCGHVLKAYVHKLNKPLIDALKQAVRFSDFQTNKHFNLQKDLDLTKNQYNNFQKLQYFWLIRPVKKWLRSMTSFWISFCQGHSLTRDTAITLGKSILSTGHTAWQWVDHKLLNIWEIQEKKYKKDFLHW